MSSMNERNGKAYIGAYIDSKTKKQLLEIAKREDRPLSYILQKVLSWGVTHQSKTVKHTS